MKRYLITSLLILLFSLNLMASEKIADFRFEKTGPLEEIIYLVDEDGNEDYGQYTHTSETSYAGFSSKYNADLYINQHTIADETIPVFNGILQPKELVNMSMAYSKFKFSRTIAIPCGIIGGVSLFAGSSLLIAFAAVYNDYVKGVSGTSDVFKPSSSFSFDLMESQFGPLFYAGIALVTFSAMAFISFFMFLGMTIYYGKQYKSAKARLLKKLNKGIIIEDRDDNDLFSLSFDLRLGS